MNMKAEDPFLCADRMVERLRGQADAIIVEIHAEATSEKQALGWHLDGRVTAVLGTHTHVPTADALRPAEGHGLHLRRRDDRAPTRASSAARSPPSSRGSWTGCPGASRWQPATSGMSAAFVEIDPSMARAARIELVTVRR